MCPRDWFALDLIAILVLNRLVFIELVSSKRLPSMYVLLLAFKVLMGRSEMCVVPSMAVPRGQGA